MSGHLNLMSFAAMSRVTTDTDHMRFRVRFGLAVLVALPLLSACGADNSDADGECDGRIRYDGVVYRGHNGLNQDASRGRQLGTGDVIGCGDAASAPKVDEVTLFSVKGVRRSIAVMVGKKEDWRGMYVAEAVPRSAWPAPLRNQ